MTKEALADHIAKCKSIAVEKEYVERVRAKLRDHVTSCAMGVAGGCTLCTKIRNVARKKQSTVCVYGDI
jgi:hypothetical protein